MRLRSRWGRSPELRLGMRSRVEKPRLRGDEVGKLVRWS